jgi:hypothetical protein
MAISPFFVVQKHQLRLANKGNAKIIRDYQP